MLRYSGVGDQKLNGVPGDVGVKERGGGEGEGVSEPSRAATSDSHFPGRNGQTSVATSPGQPSIHVSAEGEMSLRQPTESGVPPSVPADGSGVQPPRQEPSNEGTPSTGATQDLGAVELPKSFDFGSRTEEGDRTVEEEG